MTPITIALVGAPCTGKTELADALCARLPGVHRMPEYARTYISTYGAPEHPAEQMLMFRTCLQAESSLAEIYPVSVIDSPSFVYALYGKYITDRDRTKDKHRAFSDAFADVAERYANIHTLCVYTPTEDVTYTEAEMDAVRWLAPVEREELATRLLEFLAANVNEYVHARGTTENRVNSVIARLNDMGYKL